MQVFVPFPEPLKCAKALWGDRRRFNKQIVECSQILNVITGKSTAWKNHPVTKMYNSHKEWLRMYLRCFESYRNYKNSTDENDKPAFGFSALYYSRKADIIRPTFLDDSFCNQHKRRLHTKSPELYPQFEECETSEENWYFVDGVLLKYINGKRI